MKGYRFLILGLGILGLLGILGILEGCSTKPATIERPAFQADSAYHYIEKQMSFGPRVPNSAAHMQCAVWLIEQLRACGAEVELQKGQMPDYRGEMQQIYNIIGHFGTSAHSPRILLGAHYDTRPWCDEEEDYSDRFYNVPGANDGASGVGVLLEVARQIGLRNDSTTAVDIIFFDCEDMGSPRVYTGVEREDTWCLGSQLWAADYAKAESGKRKAESGKGDAESGKGKAESGKGDAESGKRKAESGKAENGKGKAERYQYGVILDMVGAPDAVFPLEMYSTQYAGNYQQTIWQHAKQLGYGALFSPQQSYPITDDHYYINRIAGIPCVDIIHYDVRNATGFPAWWHTRRDNMDHISHTTLQAVGEVVMSLL